MVKKRNLNFVLTVIIAFTMVLGMMPAFNAVATSSKTVEVATEGTTLIEAEDNVDCIVATNSLKDPVLITNVIESEDASDKEFLYSQNYDVELGTREHYWEYGFTITQNGTYTVKTRVANPWKYRFHKLTVTFGETTIASTSSTTTGDEVVWGEYEKEVTLSAGTTYLFRVETTCGTGGNHELYVDYVSVTPKELEEPIPSENSMVTVSSDEKTVIEAEENTIVTNYLKTTKSTGEVKETTEPYQVEVAEDATYLKYNYAWDNSSSDNEYYQTVTWTVPIEIVESGSYELEFCANQSAYYHGNLFAVLDGTEIVQFDNVAKETPTLVKYNTIQNLTEGTHTVSVIAKRAWNLNCTLVVDYVSLQFTDESGQTSSTVTVSATETTLIEAEDYAKTYVDDNGTITPYAATIKTDVSTASGGAYIYNNRGGAIDDAEHYWEITLDIKEEGIYEITTTVPTLSRYRFHSVKIMIESIELYSESNSWPLYNSEVAEFNDKSTSRYLKAGLYRYRFFAGKGTGGNQQLCFDALTIRPLLSDEETIRYEYENYVDANATVYEVSGASGDKVVFGYSAEEHSYQVPVTINESRYYDISYVVNKKTDEYKHSKINFSLNLESEFPLPFTNTTPETKVLEYTAIDGYVMCLYEYKSIWINKDEYILETKIDKTKDSLLKYELDYFEIKPTQSPQITQSSVSKIEMETYAGVGVYDWDRGVTETEGVSGGKAVFNSWSDIDPSWSFPVEVKDSGFYHINYVTGDKYKPWFSKVTFKLGKVTLGTNIDDYIEDCGYLLWESQPLCKYCSEWVWLDEGEYELSVLVEPDEINSVYKYQADYIEFVPAVNGISMEYGVIKLHAAYTDVTSGKVLMALYNGSKLVETTSYDLSDETYVDFEYIPEETITKVKVFIWDEDNLAKPKEMSKNFDLTEN